MDLKQLEYFVTIVKEGNISAAAQKLYMTQPPLSNQIKLLEKELDCILFERGPRNIHLTEAGQTLYQYASSVLELANVARQETMSIAKRRSQILRIGIVSSLICSRALEWLKEFSLLHPAIHYEIIEGNTYQLLQDFRSGTLQIAILRTPFNRESLICHKIFTDKLIAVGDCTQFQNTDSTITMKKLAEYPLIIYRRWKEIVLDSFEKRELKPDFFCINDDARTTMYFVENKMGIGIVPESALSQSTDTLLSKEISDMEISSDVVLACPSQQVLSTQTKEFIQFIKNLRIVE